MSKNGSFYVSPAYENKIPVTVKEIYLSESERSSLALLENTKNYWVLSYHWEDVNP